LLDWEQSCWDKEAIISSERVFDHILDMGVWSIWTGCSLNQTPDLPSGVGVGGDRSSPSLNLADLPASAVGGGLDGVNLTCRGERRYDTPRKVSRLLLCVVSTLLFFKEAIEHTTAVFLCQ